MSFSKKKVLLKIAFSIAILAGVFALLDWQALLLKLHSLSLRTLFLAAGGCLAPILLLTVRWYCIIQPHIPAPFITHLAHYWAANLFSLISPASMGSDIYRVIIGRQLSTTGILLPMTLVIRERLIGLTGICLNYLVFLALHCLNADPTHLPALFVYLGAVFTLGGILLLYIQSHAHANTLILRALNRIPGFNRRIPGPWQEKITVCAALIRYTSLKECLCFLALTQLAFISWTLVYYVLAQCGIHTDISFEKLGLISIITELARWIPITIQGLGVREATATYGSQLMGFPAEAGFILSGLAYLVNTLVLIVMGTLGLFLTHIHGKQITE